MSTFHAKVTFDPDKHERKHILVNFVSFVATKLHLFHTINPAAQMSD